MHLRTLLAASLLALAACQSTAHRNASPSETGPPEMDTDAAMARMAELATPGPQHEFLDNMAGTFDVKLVMWMDPSAPPIESTGTMTNRWVLGGRYLQGEYTSTFLGQPFAGMSLTGYDNAQGVFQGTWIDTMGTGMMPVSTGHRSGNTITFDREMFDPMQGKMVGEREVVTVQDRDHHSMVMYMVGPDGSTTKSMEIEYTRRN